MEGLVPGAYLVDYGLGLNFEHCDSTELECAIVLGPDGRIGAWCQSDREVTCTQTGSLPVKSIRKSACITGQARRSACATLSVERQGWKGDRIEVITCRGILFCRMDVLVIRMRHYLLGF